MKDIVELKTREPIMLPQGRRARVPKAHIVMPNNADSLSRSERKRMERESPADRVYRHEDGDVRVVCGGKVLTVPWPAVTFVRYAKDESDRAQVLKDEAAAEKAAKAQADAEAAELARIEAEEAEKRREAAAKAAAAAAQDEPPQKSGKRRVNKAPGEIQ